MSTDHHEALIVWCELYRSGVRVTYDADEEEFIYHKVDWLRIHNTKRFGLFQIELCNPAPEVIETVERSATILLPLLSQKPPANLKDWWFHPLELYYEGKPLQAMVVKVGVA